MMRTDAQAEPRTTGKGLPGPLLTTIELTESGMTCTDITAAISADTVVFTSVMTCGMLRQHVRPHRVSMGRGPGWSAGSSARASWVAPPEPCVQKRSWAWHVRPICFSMKMVVSPAYVVSLTLAPRRSTSDQKLTEPIIWKKGAVVLLTKNKVGS